MSELISAIVPCFNEEESLPLFYAEIVRVAGIMKSTYGAEFEFLFIDDGSKDGTLAILRDMHKKDERVRYISFSRNFGKEAAMIAGLEGSKGDYCVILDADLQHPPALIPQMYEYVAKGEYDCAATRRISRKGEDRLMSFFARSFYKIINRVSETEIVDGAQDFRFMTRQMVDAIIALPEYNRFSKGIFSWVGFNTKYIEVENVERVAGTTTWNFRKLFLYSLEGMIGYSTAPLAISSWLGVLFCLVAFVMIVVTVIKTLVYGEPVKGYPTTICVLCLVGGLQLLCMGITAQYISKMYLEVKGRPKYIKKETEDKLSNK